MSYMKKYRQKFSLIKSILGKNDPVILEIGAHYGEDTLRFLETFAESKIYCFEPDPRNIKIFKKYVKSDNVFLQTLALSDFNKRAEFYQSYSEHCGDVPEKYDWIAKEEYVNEKLNNSGSSSLKKGYKNSLEVPIYVDTIRFDTWYDKTKIGIIDFAWIDVQGAEKEVLSGMGDEIKNINFIWIEYGEREYEGAMSRTETIIFLKQKGFTVVEKISDKGSIGDLFFINSSFLKKRYGSV